MGDAIRRHQREFNRDTADLWDRYATHRARVTRLVLAAAADGAPGRLCVLGAGNCNDLDLRAIGPRFAEIHLVDLDGDAIAAGVARQGIAGATLHGGVDLTGVADALSSHVETRADDVERLVGAATAAPAPDLEGPFDVVVSDCVLTQLIDAVAHTVGTSHARSRDLALAVRDRHLRLLAELTRPGGRALLVTDTLSTAVAPELADVPDAGLHAWLAERARDGRCFLGTNPAELLLRFRKDPETSRDWSHADVAPPWRWTLRTFMLLAYALRLRRAG